MDLIHYYCYFSCSRSLLPAGSHLRLLEIEVIRCAVELVAVESTHDLKLQRAFVEATPLSAHKFNESPHLLCLFRTLREF